MDKEKLMLGKIREYHEGQTRQGGNAPYWFHCQSVGQIIRDASERTGEAQGNEELFSNVFLAALGHDLYEDTKISRQEILESFGEKVDEYIEFMTNRFGEENQKEFLDNIKKAPEEVWLIKLADLTENTIGGAYSIPFNDLKWTKDFLLPVMTNGQKEMNIVVFQKYAKTGNLLKEYLDFAINRLREHVEQFEFIEK